MSKADADKKYKQLCEKIGYDPLAIKPEDKREDDMSFVHDDRPSPLEGLTSSELLFMENYYIEHWRKAS